MKEESAFSKVSPSRAFTEKATLIWLPPARRPAFLNLINLWTENDTLNQRLIIIINQANICLISADRVLVCVGGKARAPSVASLLSLPPRWQRNTPVISHSGICIFVASLPNANYSAQKQLQRTNRKRVHFPFCFLPSFNKQQGEVFRKMTKNDVSFISPR